MKIKILDKYIIKNFLIGYLIAFGVLMGLRIVIDLFVNLDEFAENIHLGPLAVTINIFSYYALHSTLYFRDFAGMITVVAAAFSLGKMTRNNELTAVMASGVSLKRVIAPIIFMALSLIGLLVIDNECIIPPLADKLVRGQDDLPGQEQFHVWFMTDGNGSLICSGYDEKTATLTYPTIITRKRKADALLWEVTGKIWADAAVYNFETGKWDLKSGWTLKRASPGELSNFERLDSYQTDITPKEIPVRRKARHKALLSTSQLAALARQRTKVKDLAQLYSEKHFRITDPIINLVMLMVSLPILVCRDPKSMKSAILMSFILTSACFIVTFICKMVATEVFFNQIRPELWAGLPVFIFLPIAFIEFDSMKT
jgi:lipopolysaccharide export system permease protein